jgi:hypothetical protein
VGGELHGIDGGNRWVGRVSNWHAAVRLTGDYRQEKKGRRYDDPLMNTRHSEPPSRDLETCKMMMREFGSKIYFSVYFFWPGVG